MVVGRNTEKKFRFTLALDLDATLVCCVTKESLLAHGKLLRSDLVLHGGHDVVRPRPHLEEFLSRARRHYNVVVWTAASRNYAKEVVARFLPFLDIDNELFSEELCQVSQATGKSVWCYDEFGNVTDRKRIRSGHKVLAVLAQELHIPESSIIIVDNLYSVAKENPGQSVRVKDYIALSNDALHDTELCAAWNYIQNHWGDGEIADVGSCFPQSLT